MTADFSFVGVEPSVGTDFSFAPKVVDVDVSVAFALPGPTALVVVDEPRDVVVAATIAGPTVFVEFSKLTDVNLLFDRPRATNADLVFGDGEEIVIPSVDVSVAATLPLPTLLALFIPPVDVSVTALLPGPSLLADVRLRTPVHVVAMLPGITLSVETVYSSNTQRPTVGQRAAPWQVADKAEPTGATTGHSDSARAPEGWAAFWEKATGAQQGIEHRLPQVFTRSPVDLHARYRDATGIHAGPTFLHQDATRQHQRTDGVFQDGSKVRSSTDFRHQDGDRTKRTSRLSFFQDATGLSMHRGTDFQAARPAPRAWETLFQDGVPPPPGIWVKPIDPPEPPCYTPDPHLLFSWPWGYNGSHLVFQCGDFAPGPAPAYVIPLLKVYMTIHTLTAQLLPSLEPVVLRDVAIASDDDGYGWSFSGTGPEHLLDQLAPQAGMPAQIRVTLDGISWVFAVQSLSRTRRFGEHRVSVQGASITALLGNPYMPEQTWLDDNGATAQQLLEQALQYTGVGVDWGITDWYVPPGVWSFQGTPLAAALRIAEAAGAVLRSHRTDAQLILAPRYPVMPWEWGAALINVEMPAAVIATDELRPDARPDYNAVYISGQAGGVLGHVRRTGTAGDLLAPQVTDSLITHADAARQRGRAVLGAGGKKLVQSITMPLITGGTAPGLINPGQLIEVADTDSSWRGLVRATRVNAAMPVVRQQITVERVAV